MSFFEKISIKKIVPQVTLFCAVCGLTLGSTCQLSCEQSRAALYVRMSCDELALLEIRTFGFGEKNNYRNENMSTSW